MEPSWGDRELPILRAVLAAEEAGQPLERAAFEAVPGLSKREVLLTLDRLGAGGYLDVSVTRSGGGEIVVVMIRRVLPPTLRELAVWPPAATPLAEKRRRRLAFMERVYERTDGNTTNRVFGLQVGAELGWDQEMTSVVMHYLVDEGLIEFRAMPAMLAITHAGVVEMEQALSNPKTSTHHFPPMVTIHVHGDIVNSQLQAGTIGSTQERT
jgi:hypothetical protein